MQLIGIHSGLDTEWPVSSPYPLMPYLGTNVSIELNPNNAFEAAIIKMVEMHRMKAIDYTGKSHPNQNFYDSAYQLSQTGGHSVEQLIATKQSRLRVLLPKHWTDGNAPVNEGLDDTFLDRAVYSVIAMTLWAEGGYNSSSPPKEGDIPK